MMVQLRNKFNVKAFELFLYSLASYASYALNYAMTQLVNFSNVHTTRIMQKIVHSMGTKCKHVKRLHWAHDLLQ